MNGSDDRMRRCPEHWHLSLSSDPPLKTVTELICPDSPGKRFDFHTIAPDESFRIPRIWQPVRRSYRSSHEPPLVATVSDTHVARGSNTLPELKKFLHVKCWRQYNRRG